MTTITRSSQTTTVAKRPLAQDPRTEPTGQLASAGSRFWLLLALLTVYIIWGSTYLVIRIALEAFPPFFMAGVRFLIAGGILFLFLHGRGVPAPSRKEWIGAGLVGTLLLAGGNGGVVFAEQSVPSGLAALAVGTVPLWAAIFAGLWGRRPSKMEWIGLVIGFVGIALLNLGGDLRANPVGATALILSPLCWAFGSVWSRQLSLPSGLMASAAEMLIGGAVLTLMGAFSGEPIPNAFPVRPVLAMAYLVVFGSIIAFSAYGYLLRQARPALATSYAYVNPVVAVALGVLLANERLTSTSLLAMPAILIGVIVVMLAQGRRTGDRGRE